MNNHQFNSYISDNDLNYTPKLSIENLHLFKRFINDKISNDIEFDVNFMVIHYIRKQFEIDMIHHIKNNLSFIIPCKVNENVTI